MTVFNERYSDATSMILTIVYIYIYINVMVKVKFTLEQATKAQMWSGGIALLFS